ncbi:hypothetical protein TRFO_26966 [Tritrichomonas foetus]|uniref:Uncharacterized protein n=1 Tax=Tritrichomonas foetus TaxID=1144522 RepID=A0A1J4K6I4_9EUKA|nr:hypothetical protein TRFO_26966 [Tritrichomonas foetus]|eukprot:OHT05332.1 hypothetical protein TRFO_26966 [Tritrichomonas foetus]
MSREKMKGRRETLWCIIGVLNNDGTVKSEYKVDKLGRLKHRFPKSKPRNLATALREMKQPDTSSDAPKMPDDEDDFAMLQIHQSDFDEIPSASVEQPVEVQEVQSFPVNLQLIPDAGHAYDSLQPTNIVVQHDVAPVLPQPAHQDWFNQQQQLQNQPINLQNPQPEIPDFSDDDPDMDFLFGFSDQDIGLLDEDSEPFYYGF